MGKERENDGRQVFESMVCFAKSGPCRNVNNFVLVGPVNVPTMFHTFVGTFPKLSGSDSSISVAGTKGDNATDVYSQILDLQVPKRVEDLKIKDSWEIRKALEMVSAQGNLPSIMIGIGETRDTEERVITLFSVAGISPKKALLEMQDRVKKRMSQFN